MDLPGNFSTVIFELKIVEVLLELLMFGLERIKISAELVVDLIGRIQQAFLPLISRLAGDAGMMAQHGDIGIRRQLFFL